MNLKILLSTTFITASLISSAQNTGKCYAITGKVNNNFFWTDIKQVDLVSGKVIKTVFEADKTPFKITSINNTGDIARKAVTNPTGLGVAACALDAMHNRLYFSPMRLSDIYYLDLNAPDINFTSIKAKAIASPSIDGEQPEENQITRMVIAADGFGYALTNDANHLIRFGTGKNPSVEDLGSVIDGSDNKGVSIHNKCTSWGGDMVADAFGKLFVVAANHYVFTIDVTTRIATLKGTITGLPANFTTNGAAVDNDGNMIVSSANVFDGLYTVNMKDLSAVKVPSTEAPFNASDLANGNFLLQKEANAANSFSLTKSPLPLTTISDSRIFPNPVAGQEFRVLFDGQKAGQYTILLTDLAGRPVQSKVVAITKPGQTATVRLTRSQAKGTYLVRILNDKKIISFSEKVVIE